MLRLLLIISLLFSDVIIYAQSESGWHDQSHFVHGINYGLSPIYRNEHLGTSLFLESENKVTIKDLPIDIKFRISNEKFYYGQANYFKISYNASRYKGTLKNKYLTQLNELYSLITDQQSNLAKYESKLAYWQIKYPNGMKKPSYDTLNLHSGFKSSIGNNTFGLDTTISSFDKPKSDTEYNLDPSNYLNKDAEKFQKCQDSIGAIQERIQTYKNTYQDLQQKYQKLNEFKGTDYLSKFTAIDVGLTGLKTSGSGSTVPIQGLNMRYEEDKYFIELGAGLTLPNQILTTNIYQQIAYNEVNVFNSGSNFNVNTTKLLARVNVGYGQLSGNNIALETFYNSRILKFGNGDTLYNISSKDKITSNLNGRLCLLRKKNLIISSSAGVTWLDKNKDEIALKENFGGSFQGEYSIKKQKFKAGYRYFAANYDAWVQGVFLAQNERIELSHQLKLTNKLGIRYLYARNRYFSNEIFGGTSSNEYGINTGYYGRNFGFSMGYSLLNMVDRTTEIMLENNLNHMANMMLFVTKRIKNNNRYSLNIDNSNLFLSTRDTSLKVVSSSLSNRITFDKFGVGLTLKHQYYQGLKDIYGNFYTIQPELSVKIKDFYFRGFLAMNQSEQFNWTYGGTGEVGFRFDKYLSWSVEIQKFLQNEYILFRDVGEGVQPYIIKLKMKVDL